MTCQKVDKHPKRSACKEPHVELMSAAQIKLFFLCWCKTKHSLIIFTHKFIIYILLFCSLFQAPQASYFVETFPQNIFSKDMSTQLAENRFNYKHAD